MAQIKHAKTSTKSDSGDSSLIQPSDWNADHTFTGLVETSGDQTITGEKTLQPADVNSRAVVIQALASQVANVLEGRTAGGQLTGYMNEKGELRAQPASINSVPFRVKQSGASQVANLTEWVNAGNTVVLAYVGPDGAIRSTVVIGTKHIGAGTPSGGQSGDILVGNGRIWVNDAGTWKSVTVS